MQVCGVGIRALILFAFIFFPDPHAIHCRECDTPAEYGLRGSKEGGGIRYYCKSHGPTKGCLQIDPDRAGRSPETHTSQLGAATSNPTVNRACLCMAAGPAPPALINRILSLLQHGFRRARRRKGRRALPVPNASSIRRAPGHLLLLGHGRQQQVSA